MAVIAQRLAGPVQPDDAAPTLLFQVPGDRTVIVKQILVANTTGTAATVTIGIGGVAAADALMFAVSIAANTLANTILSLPMQSGEELVAQQGTASALTVTVSGVEVEA